MIDLNAESYENQDDVGVLEKCIEWHRICPEIYTIIRNGKSLIGYINFVPITRECYLKIKNGELKDYEFQINDILDFKKGENYCLFMSIVIKEKYRNTKVIIEMMKYFFKKMDRLKRQGVELNNVICDCVSEDGEKLINRNFDAKFICYTKNRTKIYEFSIQ